MVIMYDARKEGLFSVCNCTRGTVFYIVLQSPMFWLLTVVHASLLVTEKYLAANGSGLVPVDWKVATGSLSLLTFFLVFYSGNCYARYYQLHAHCVGINGGVMVWSSLINAHFGRTLAAASRRQEITTPFESTAVARTRRCASPRSCRISNTRRPGSTFQMEPHASIPRRHVLPLPSARWRRKDW